MDCIEGACLYAITETGTTIITGFRTAVRDKGKHRTVSDSMILIICLRLIAGSLTGYKCNLFRLFSRFYAHDLCDLFSNRLTAHRTGIDRRFSFGNCCRQICTARITAAAAVISRKG